MDEAKQIGGEHWMIPYVDETVAPEPRRARSRSTRSARSQDRELRRSIAELNTRFDVVMSSLVRSEQAVLRAERVATEAALSFREEARILEDTIAAITPVYEGE